MMATLPLSAEGTLAYKEGGCLSLCSQNAVPAPVSPICPSMCLFPPTSGKPFAGGDCISSIISYTCLGILASDCPSPAIRGQGEMCLIREGKKREGKVKARQE